MLLCSVLLFAQTKTQIDSVVAVVANDQGLPLVPREELPFYGTFWTVRPSIPCVLAPLPCPPLADWPIYAIGNGQFLVDETGGLLLSQPNRFGALSSAEASSIISQQAEELLNHIAWIQEVQLRQSMQMSTLESDGPLCREKAERLEKVAEPDSIHRFIPRTIFT